MFYQLKSYFKFLLKSTNEHGVHSPFVYDFVTKCLYNKQSYQAYQKIKSYRKQLSNSTKMIAVKDFGAGSKTLNAKRRAVSKMVKKSSSPLNDAKLLFRIAKYFKFQNTLELGTSLGVGTISLALGHIDNYIITVEGCPETHQFSKEQFEIQKLSKITPLNLDFNTAITNLNGETYDCIFFDGHHNKKATLEYFNDLVKSTHNDSIFIFDDIYWSKDMTQAWHEIISDHRVSVSIDTFRFGFVFFRKEQPKQHFRIRL